MQTITTLKSFLDSIQLEQYLEAFINAGATDQDLPQLVQFNEQELAEFLSALDMLPFHSIKFKKGLRELKHSHSDQQQQEDTRTVTEDTENCNNAAVLPSTREFIIAHATIYGKKKNRPLTSYEEAINSAALQLALDNPLLISKKGGLFDLAKKKLLEDGYRYKRGSSRSKLRDDNKKSTISLMAEDQQQQLQHEQQQRDILVKRQENAQRMSDKRLEKIRILQLQVEQALQCRQNTENKLAGGGCHDTLTRLGMEADLIRYEESKIKLTKEISKLKAQERKHQWYKRRKLERGLSQSTDEGFYSQNSSSYMDDDSSHHSGNNVSDDNRYVHHPTAFSICAPSSTTYTFPCTFHSSQEYNGDDEDTPFLPPSSSSSTTTTTILTCSRESDVRASSISDYDR